MRTIPSESCFVHGLLTVTVTFVCYRGRQRHKTRSKKISAVVWGSGACELAIGIQICGVDYWYRFSRSFALKSHVGISAFRLRVQGKERFCTTSLSCSYWSTASSGSGSPPRPTNAATSMQGSARCFSAHQATIASLVFGGKHCIPSCSWRLCLVLRSLCGCRIRTVVSLARCR